MNKITIDRPALSSEEIERFKNFNSMLGKYIPKSTHLPFTGTSG